MLVMTFHLQIRRFLPLPATNHTVKLFTIHFVQFFKIFLTFLFYFILFATLITKNIGKEEKKKKWRGDLTETIGAYERLGLLEL